MRFVKASEWAEFITPPRYLIEGVLPENSFVMAFGEPNVGKSLIALDMACSIACGRSWLGHPVIRSGVVYVSGEGRQGIRHRIQAWCNHNGVPLESLKLYVAEDDINVLDPEEFEAFTNQICGLPDDINLVIFDTLASVAPGLNDDRAADISTFASACGELIELGAAVLVVHHSGHKDKLRARGSIALKGAVDCEFAVLRTTTDEVVRMTCTKMKDGRAFADIFLRFQNIELEATDGRPVQTTLLLECDAPVKGRPKTAKFEPTPNDLMFGAALGDGPQDEMTVRAAFMAAHPKDVGDAGKNYLRVRARALKREWCSLEDHKLIPNLEALERDGLRRQPT